VSASTLDKGDLLILNVRDDATLAKWWCLLNNWGWPEEIQNPEDKNAPAPRRRSKLMDEIVTRIGFKACLREWNRERMTDEVFEAWWERRELTKEMIQ